MSNVLADLLASPTTFGSTPGQSGNPRAVFDQLRDLQAEKGDFAYPAAYAAINEVQRITKYADAVDGGTFTLTFNLKDGTFTTAAIAFGAAHATVQTAINTAAALASYPGWASNHIVVSGGTLSTADLVLTFSGASVSARHHGLTTVDASSLTVSAAPADDVVTSVDTNGQTKRTGWAALKMLGIVTSDPPVQGDDLEDPTVVERPFPSGLDQETVVSLIQAAAIEDENKVTETVLLAALGL